jgi:DNA-binding transcriptional LysR family regulator
MDRMQAMEVFRAVVEEQGFARAGQRLGLSPASVSRHVAELERHLGARLLHRTTRSLRPTDEGRAYFDRCVSILDQIHETERSIREVREVPMGLLRVSAAPAFGVLVLAPMLPAFHASHPLVKLDLSLADRPVDLVREGFDLALRFTESDQLPDSSLIARHLATYPNKFVASPAYVAVRGLPAGPADLARHSVLTDLWRSAPQDIALDGDVTVRVDGPLRTDNTLLTRHAALAGTGIALLPEYVVQEDLRTGALVTVLPDSRARPLRLYAVYPPTRTLAARVRRFIEHVADGLALATGQELR